MSDIRTITEQMYALIAIKLMPKESALFSVDIFENKQLFQLHIWEAENNKPDIIIWHVEKPTYLPYSAWDKVQILTTRDLMKALKKLGNAYIRQHNAIVKSMEKYR